MKIDSKITSYKVVVPGQDIAPVPPPVSTGMHEALDRPEELVGRTYKFKTPDSDHAIYVTINDMMIDGQWHPYEIFINSKNIEQFQWIIGMTRLISAIFRKGGEIKFIADELKQVFSPTGGYFAKGHGYIPSVVAHLGIIIEAHLNHE
jgi:hypothetical protein